MKIFHFAFRWCLTLIFVSLFGFSGCGGDDDEDGDAADDDQGDDDDDLADDDADDDMDDDSDDDADDDADDDEDDDLDDDDDVDDDVDDDTDDDTDDDADDDTGTECDAVVTPVVAEPEMVEIEPGVFMQGSPDDEPGHSLVEKQREVTLTKGFLMAKYEVSQAEWLGVMGSIRDGQVGCGDDYPMAVITWFQAIEYANALSTEFGYTPCYTVDGEDVTWNASCDGYRLPTEAEWEYAARAGSTTAFYNGPLTDFNCGDAGLDEIAWYCWGGYDIGEIGAKVPNDWGLYDMAGLVWEWTFDGYDQEDFSYVPDGPVADPVAPGTLGRVYRGGSMFAVASDCRSAYRRLTRPTLLDDDNGMRLARNLPDTD